MHSEVFECMGRSKIMEKTEIIHSHAKMSPSERVWQKKKPFYEMKH